MYRVIVASNVCASFVPTFIVPRFLSARNVTVTYFIVFLVDHVTKQMSCDVLQRRPQAAEVGGQSVVTV